MVTMTGFRYERDGPGTKLWPVRCSWNTTGQVPKLCGGGESIWWVCNCRKLLCRAEKSSMCVLSCCSWCCHYTTTTPTNFVMFWLQPCAYILCNPPPCHHPCISIISDLTSPCPPILLWFVSSIKSHLHVCIQHVRISTSITTIYQLE